ncbi:MAG: hypothetical protein BAA01_09380 [Bacillus thermozeamaize]|uniref:Uncharacterized protein n=1 Tax=Bacillus thermozeamaize TaxID=230954 RepID=A0A1Y3PEA0_9BACI|nr:MAG: hypothetical protein BAA01_09380 [Bacillus thermozeamaize]
MQTKEISVGFMYTKNLGNYQSLKVDAGVVMTVEDGDDIEEVYQKAWETVKKQVKRGLESANGGNF